jgi:hypothetical protein
MPGGDDSNKWLISELTALRNSVSEIQDRLGDYVEEPTDDFGSKADPPKAMPASRVGLRNDEREKLDRYRPFFEYAPVALWCHDASELKAYLQALRDSGVTDLLAYLRGHPECLVQCVNKIRFLDANSTALRLLKASSKETLISDFPKVFSERTYNSFVHYFTGVADGKIAGQRQVVLHTLEGEEIYVLLRWRVPPDYEKSFAQVLVCAVDLSAPRASE